MPAQQADEFAPCISRRADDAYAMHGDTIPVLAAEMVDNPLLQVPPASRGEPNPCAVPLVKRGEPTERGNCELWRRSWYQNHTVNRAERETPL